MENFNDLAKILSEQNFPVEVILTTDPEALVESCYNDTIHTIERKALTYCNAGEFFPVLCQPTDYINGFQETLDNLYLSNEVLEYLNILFTRTCETTLVTCTLKPQVPYGSNHYIILGNCLNFELGPTPDALDLGLDEGTKVVRGIKSEYYVFIAQEEFGSDIDPDGLAQII